MKEYVRRVKQTVEASWMEGAAVEDDEEDPVETGAEEGEMEGVQDGGAAPLTHIPTAGEMEVEIAGDDGRG